MAQIHIDPIVPSDQDAVLARAAQLGYAVVLSEDEGAVTEQVWDRLVEEGRIDGLLVARQRRPVAAASRRWRAVGARPRPHGAGCAGSRRSSPSRG